MGSAALCESWPPSGLESGSEPGKAHPLRMGETTHSYLDRGEEKKQKIGDSRRCDRPNPPSSQAPESRSRERVCLGQRGELGESLRASRRARREVRCSPFALGLLIANCAGYVLRFRTLQTLLSLHIIRISKPLFVLFCPRIAFPMRKNRPGRLLEADATGRRSGVGQYVTKRVLSPGQQR